MKKTMLTYRTLDRFEAEYITTEYSETEIAKIEHAAYAANLNGSCGGWNEDEIYADFLRILAIYHIRLTSVEVIDIDAVCWRCDPVTRRHVAGHRRHLSRPGAMEPRDLADACTYCYSTDNPYAAELIRRSGCQRRPGDSDMDLLRRAASGFSIKLV